jgi:hypothetical protein
MGQRVDNANDLGAILSLATPRKPVAMPAHAAPPPTTPTVSSSPVGGIGATIRRTILRI